MVKRLTPEEVDALSSWVEKKRDPVSGGGAVLTYKIGACGDMGCKGFNKILVGDTYCTLCRIVADAGQIEAPRQPAKALSFGLPVLGTPGFVRVRSEEDPPLFKVSKPLVPMAPALSKAAAELFDFQDEARERTLRSTLIRKTDLSLKELTREMSSARLEVSAMPPPARFERKLVTDMITPGDDEDDDDPPLPPARPVPVEQAKAEAEIAAAALLQEAEVCRALAERVRRDPSNPNTRRAIQAILERVNGQGPIAPDVLREAGIAPAAEVGTTPRRILFALPEDQEGQE